MRQLRTIHIAGKNGLKGRHGSMTLSGADVFTGPNGAGKTTWLLSVTAGLRGLSEAVIDGKRGADGREFLGPDRPEASVTLTWDDGEVLTRDLAKVRGKECDRATYEADRIAGAHVVRFDLVDFASLTDGARAKLLEQAVATGAARSSLDIGAIVTKIRKVLSPAEPQVPAGHVWYDLVVAHAPVSVSPSAWLTKALEWAAEAFTGTNAAQKKAVTDADTARAGNAEDPPDGTIQQARVEEARLAGEILVAERADSAAKESVRRHVGRAAEGERLARAAGEAADAVARCDAEVDRLRKAVLPGGEAPVEARRAAQAAYDEAVAALGQAEADLSMAAVALGAARSGVTSAEAKLATIRALAGNVGGTDAVCVHCGGVDPLVISAMVAGAEEAVTRARIPVEDAEADHGIAARNYRKAQTARDAAGSALDAAETAEATIMNARRAHKEQVDRANAQYEKEAAAQTKADLALAAWQDEERADTGSGAAAIGGAEDLEAQITGLKALLLDAKRVLELHVRHSERQGQAQRAVADREKAVARFDQVKALKGILIDLQAELARDAYGPIEKAANTFFEKAGLVERVVIKSESDFGAKVPTEDGKGVVYASFWSLSASEKALVGVALSVAMATLTKAPWKAVLLDGAEVIDENRRVPVYTALSEMVKERLVDNVIITQHCVDPALVPCVDGLDVHWVGR